MNPFDPNMERPAQFNATGTYQAPGVRAPRSAVRVGVHPVDYASLERAPAFNATGSYQAPGHPFATSTAHPAVAQRPASAPAAAAPVASVPGISGAGEPVAPKPVGVTPIGCFGQYAPKSAPAPRQLPQAGPELVTAIRDYVNSPPQAGRVLGANDAARGRVGPPTVRHGGSVGSAVSESVPQQVTPFRTLENPEATPSVGVAGASDSPSRVGITLGTWDNPLQGNPRSAHAAGPDRLWDLQRHQMLQQSHGTMQALLNPGGRYAGMTPEERVASLNALSGHFGNLANADTQMHVHGNDPRNSPAYQQALIGHLNAQAKNLESEAVARDPNRTIDMMRTIANDPALRNYDLKRQGVSQAEIDAQPFPLPATAQAGTIPGVAGPNGPRPAIHTGNVDQALTNPQLAGLNKVLSDQGLDFHQKVSRAASMDGFDDANHPTRQAFDAWLHQQFPTQADWQKHIEAYPAIGPDQWQAKAFGFEWPGKETIGGPVMNLFGHLFGYGGTGTGWGWRQNYDNGRELFDQMAKHNIRY